MSAFQARMESMDGPALTRIAAVWVLAATLTPGSVDGSLWRLHLQLPSHGEITQPSRS